MRFTVSTVIALPVQFIILAGRKLGGAEFYDTERTTIVAAFLKSPPKP